MNIQNIYSKNIQINKIKFKITEGYEQATQTYGQMKMSLIAQEMREIQTKALK